LVVSVSCDFLLSVSVIWSFLFPVIH